MNENAMQDTALRNLLTHNLESDDMKKFIDSLNVSKDDDSAIQELKNPMRRIFLTNRYRQGMLFLGRLVCEIGRFQIIDRLPL